jgi:hypothetical protein
MDTATTPPSHDEMLGELRVLIVISTRQATTSDDLVAIASLLNAYTHAVEHPHWRPG